jgi:hypothetical protein
MRKEDERMSLFSDVGHNAFEERLELLVFSMIPAEVPYRKVASFYFYACLESSTALPSTLQIHGWQGADRKRELLARLVSSYSDCNQHSTPLPEQCFLDSKTKRPGKLDSPTANVDRLNRQHSEPHLLL